MLLQKQAFCAMETLQQRDKDSSHLAEDNYAQAAKLNAQVRTLPSNRMSVPLWPKIRRWDVKLCI
jgi:hypothetical protein